ncbi:quinone oxidoreductase family protein [Chitinophaga ginsengisoli]|uniref:enoyl-[acyl-carrier-protein] reductase n=1 Tax=Chitinophaga ginsengisoli TaxID=363837 RepID=A0A2P8GI28_9BACT|nr:zinc-binding dehydrogenase [Chitinophaga ginsengisoli]PSL33626.1 NADPH:quinone reductase-like Zn-dependent oxidoreductase [Chitinophaga ginsengisoli]
MKAIVFDQIGSPEDVLELRNVPVPEIGDNEVLVRMVATSINPGDFLFIQNLYPEPKKPQFPGQIAGNHGAGIIEKAGRQVKLQPGTFVAFSYYNTWAEYAAVPSEWLIRLPADYPIELASQFVNLITAWDLLDQAGLVPGQWLALTAGNSSVSTMVTQLARHMGINVISLIRQAQATVDLTSMGANAIIELSKLQEDVNEQIMRITQNKGINGVIDNVGGPVTGELIRSMAFGGRVIINGGMSANRFELHNFDILMSGIEIKSHVYRYFFNPPKEADTPILNEIITISAQPGFQVPLGGIHDLEDFNRAITESIEYPQKGKHIFKISHL